MTQREATTAPPLFAAIPRDDFMRLEVSPISYLVDGILVSGSTTLFSGREKAGKGLILIDLAVSIANGEPFLDRAVLEGPVIYIALEEYAATLQSRIEARDKGNGGYPLYVVRADGSVEGQEFRIDTERGIKGLIELTEQIQPVLVIIDPLREAHSGRENESDDMAPRLRALRPVAHQTNTAFIVSHYAGKMSGTFRGSTAVQASFDDGLLFTREDNDTESDVRGVLRAEGRNLQKAVEHIAFDGDSHRGVVTGVPAVELMPNLRQRILSVLHEEDEWLDARGIEERISGVKLKTIQNKLSDMARERPRPFLMDSETARKDRPRRYHGQSKRMDIPNGSGNGVENEESRTRNITPIRRPDGEVVFG